MYKERAQKEIEEISGLAVKINPNLKTNAYLNATSSLKEIVGQNTLISPKLAYIFYRTLRISEDYGNYLDSTSKLDWLVEKSSEQIVKKSHFLAPEKVFVSAVSAQYIANITAWHLDQSAMDQDNLKNLRYFTLSTAEQNTIAYLDQSTFTFLGGKIISYDDQQEFPIQSRIKSAVEKIDIIAKSGRFVNDVDLPDFGLGKYGLTPTKTLNPEIWNPN